MKLVNIKNFYDLNQQVLGDSRFTPNRPRAIGADEIANVICELVTNFDPTLGQLEVAPQEIGRVLLNLYNNAFYAVNEQAKQLSDPDYKPTIEVSTHQLASGVQIRVRDNGTGMPESVKGKIFQPFFTTKPTGEGTGLGLSLSYDIITKGHQGSLSVSSQQGQGTEFIIQLRTATKNA